MQALDSTSQPLGVTPMQSTTSRRARISASSESHLTDTKTSAGPVLETIVKSTCDRCSNSDSELSELSDEDAEAPSRAEKQCELEGAEEEMDSEEDTCEYSAYRGSDSEVSISFNSKKRSHNVKRRPKVILGNTEGGNYKFSPLSETVYPLLCFPRFFYLFYLSRMMTT